jgi:hypothetical protein
MSRFKQTKLVGRRRHFEDAVMMLFKIPIVLSIQRWLPSSDSILERMRSFMFFVHFLLSKLGKQDCMG